MGMRPAWPSKSVRTDMTWSTCSGPGPGPRAAGLLPPECWAAICRGRRRERGARARVGGRARRREDAHADGDAAGKLLVVLGLRGSERRESHNLCGASENLFHRIGNMQNVYY